MESPLKNIEKYSVVLASNSPRRRELLSMLGVKFTTRVLDNIDESYPKDIPVDEVATYISMKKSHSYCALMADNELVITADTIVVCGNEVLGKPADKGEACCMLRKLSGRSHKVITGVTIATKKSMISFKSETEVDFSQLKDSEIEYYVETYKPLDKAGAYGIQEWIGGIGVTGIRGSYYNVMGLPVQKLYQALRNID